MSSIKQRIQEIKQEIQGLEFQLALKKAALNELESLISKKNHKTSQRIKAPREGSLGAQIKKIFNDSPVPMTVAEIVDALEQRKYSSNAKVPLNNLVPSALSRRPDLFYRVKHGVYGLRGKHDINQEE